MPEMSEIRKANEIEHKGHFSYIWQACLDCGKERWVQLLKKKPVNQRCRTCNAKHLQHSGIHNNNWRGGRYKDGKGYVMVWVSPDNFFRHMVDKKGYVLEHRLIMAKHLKRCLLSWEIVHHKGTQYPLGSIENKSDNRIENLELIKGRGKHNMCIERELKRQAKQIEALQGRIILLEAENTLLGKAQGSKV